MLAPHGNHGENIEGPTLAHPPALGAPAALDRQRLSLDLAPDVALLLDHVSARTGLPKSQLATEALLAALPALLERADGLQKRAQAIHQAQRQQGGKR